jgi:hypothetical protein
MGSKLSHNEAQAGSLQQAILNVTRGKNIVDAIVTAVDEVKFTCTVKVNSDIGDGVLFYQVPLAVLVSAQASVIQIPKLNTECLLCFRDGNIQRPQLFSINEADKFLITIGNSTLEITADLFKFNGGSNGGLVLVNALVSQLNTLQNAFNTHVHILTLTAGTGTAAPTAAPVTPTTANDIQSTVIKQ